MFIYLITNTVNGKYYVGQHKHADLGKYIAGCIKRALRGKDEKPLLYRALRKYGADNFTLDVLTTARAQEQLDNLERLWILALDARNPESGYNVAHGGEGGYGKGLPEHYRAEHSRRMSGEGNPQFGKITIGLARATLAARVGQRCAVFAARGFKLLHRRSVHA